jgi:fructose-1-phosphate kinase PfkB-like protein
MAERFDYRVQSRSTVAKGSEALIVSLGSNGSIVAR